jgi:peptide/nickel transport system permease protein
VGRYVSQRLIESLIVLGIMSFAIYALIGLMPGDPIDLMISADPRLTPADALRLKALYGLDQPIAERYWAWLKAAVTGEFGYSRMHAQPVIAVLAVHLGRTALLMGISFVLAVAIAIPLGLEAALKPYSRTDYAINLMSFAGVSVPPFWLALLLIMLFAVGLDWLPAGGLSTPGDGGVLDRAEHLVLPVATVTLLTVAGITRFMRAEAIAAMRQDYVRTAFAKGLSERRVVLGHVLRNAMIPVVTVLALEFGTIFSGALITETVFNYPGMGKMIFDATLGKDYNLALAGLLFATALTLLCNLGADLGYAMLDPRISYR